MTKRTVAVALTGIYFEDMVIPKGFLAQDKACHALWYYYVVARRNYEEEFKGERIVYEGEPDQQYNYRQLFNSIATIYGTTPERMVHFWKNVDMQAAILELPALPDEERYRFNRTPEVRTEQ
jgi:hypothetical protein